MSATFNVGILGLGTVGQGVWKHLTERPLPGIRLSKASVRDLKKERSVALPKEALTEDPWEIVNDPEIHIVCELIGGTDIAKELTLAALKQGKTVISANKALICEHGAEIFDTAQKHGAHFFFEASVAGGIPIIKSLREGLVANQFPQICGILNGTSNYILTRMEADGLGFEEILSSARELGYVEADESLDLDGWDAAHKAVILAYLAHGIWAPLDQLNVKGIRSVELEDILFAKELGYKIKLLANIERIGADAFALDVQPTLIAKSAILASVDGVFNGAALTGDVAGTTLLIGRGAGQDATASAVISDLSDAVKALRGKEAPQLKNTPKAPLKLAEPKDILSAHYLRLSVKDSPGTLAEITQVLAKGAISIAHLIQHPSDSGNATIVMMTHESSTFAMEEALRALGKLSIINEEITALRVYEPDI